MKKLLLLFVAEEFFVGQIVVFSVEKAKGKRGFVDDSTLFHMLSEQKGIFIF